MNRADEVFRVSEMISRCILGELTDAEKLWLEKWVGVSPENKELFDRLVAVSYTHLTLPTTPYV